jgi:putative ABC transport system substrate-binding protein
VGDPVGTGIVASLARPGGNITALTVTGMSRVAFLQDKSERAWSEQSMQAVARELGIKILLAEPTSNDYEPAFALIARERVDALLVGAGGRNFGNRQLILDFAAKNRLPAMYQIKDYVAAGGLIASATDVADLWRRLAAYVDLVLKGAKPGDLPVERTTKFLLTINLKAAKALGITVPPSLLTRADEVIE